MLRRVAAVYKTFRRYSKGPEKYTVVMVRDGQSEYDKHNLFAGWFDSKLSELGKQEAKIAGQTLLKGAYKFDVAFTSVLTRATETLLIILQELQQQDMTVRSSWRLNERHYGDLTGLDKKKTALKYGSKQVQKWQRQFNVCPPAMLPSHRHYDSIRNDPRYGEADMGKFPLSESLEAITDRMLPYWDNVIIPEIKDGKRVLIVAHGNSLRALVKHLDQISDEDIPFLYVPPGIPFLYKLDEKFTPIPNGSLLYLGDPEIVRKAITLMTKIAKSKRGPKQN